MTILLLELVGSFALCWALVAALWARQTALPRPLRFTIAALFATLLIQHGSDIAEALGATWVDAIGDSIAGGLPFLWAFFLLQLTELVYQRRARVEQAQVASLLEDVPAAVAVLDAEGRLLSASSYWKQLHPGTTSGRTLDSLVPDAPHGLLAAVAACTTNQTRTTCTEERGSGESERWWSWTVSGWSRGELTRGVLVLLEDITARVVTEADDARLREQLASTQRLALVGELAAGAAHDLNNLLAVLGGHVELLREGSDDPNEQRESLTAMEQAVGIAGELTHGMLRLARPNHGDRTRVSVSRLCVELGRVLSRTLPREHRLEVLTTAQPLEIVASPTRLQQLVLNLIVNARDAMPSGGRILVRVERAGDQLRLAVEDSGTGIPQAQLQQIFNPFFTTKGQRGTGLGLSVVRSVVEECGGTVSVASTVGQGTTFTVELPLAPRHGERAGAANGSALSETVG